MATGFKTYAAHITQSEALRTLNREVAHTPRAPAGAGLGFGVDAVMADEDDSGGLETLQPEQAARLYLQHAVASDDMPMVSAEAMGPVQPEFRSLGAEELPLTNSTAVKFRQEYDKVPVYGSLVTVELDDSNQLISLNSAMSSPSGVDPTPSITMADAVKAAAGDIDPEAADAQDAGLYYYRADDAWHLAYIVKDVRTANAELAGTRADVVVDAHDGSVISILPRLQSEEEPIDDAADELGQLQRFRFVREGATKMLSDDEFGVETYDFSFGAVNAQDAQLPGARVLNPPTPWDATAVSAQVNAVLVARYLRQVLRRDSYDGKGARFRQSVRCTWGNSGPEWLNAAWYSNQMVFGQKTVNGELRSYAVSADVVAHEMFHGLTSATARLEYRGISGALNESYSDIFGVIVSNAAEPDPDRWNWQIGEQLNGTGLPLRDLSDPPSRGQPDQMSAFVPEVPTSFNDWGGVHKYSGIHNKAAYNLLTARDDHGRLILQPQEVAATFYLALTQQLTRNSDFADSRRGVLVAAGSLFRNDPLLADKISTIERAFDAVGIAASD